MEFIESVSVALEKKGRFLIIKRSETGPHPGIWEFPSGRIDPGEIPEDTAKREVLEETGLKIHDIQFIGTSDRFPDNRHCHIHHFHTTAFSGELTLSKEHSDALWASKEEIFQEPNIGNDTTKFFEFSQFKPDI